MQEALETIHRKTLQHFPLNPLQPSTRIPFEMFNSPLKIKEDLEFKRKTYKAAKGREYKDMTDPSELFEVDGRPAENIYMLGEAGRGKTGQCYQLIHHWVEARKAQKGSKKLSNWQKALLVFDFLFFVSLRHIGQTMHSVIEMICSGVMKTFPQYHETIRQILTSGMHTRKILIVIDGLDERKGEVEIDVNMSRCTVLRTSRHWKFYDLAPDINDLDRVVEVCGLDDYGREQIIEKVLVNYFGIDEKLTECKTKVGEIAKATRDKKYNSIMDIPLLLTAFVHLWQTNTSIQESMTGFYAALLNLLIKLAFMNKRVSKIPAIQQPMKKIDYPSFMTKQKKLSDHLQTLVLIGKVAFEDLVFGNQQNKYDETEEHKDKQKERTLQLVFEKDKLSDKMTPDVLTFALEVGLLSQSSAPGSFDDENVSINFFHKTVEEFLAALYIVCSNKVSVNSFLLACSSTKYLMELSNVLMFLVGLQPSLGYKISKHIARIADSDAEIVRYRQGFHEDQRKIELLFNTLCDYAKEMEFSLTQSEVTVKSKQFLVSDVHIDRLSDKWTVAFATKLLQQGYDNIVSLNIDYYVSEEYIPLTVVENFLGRTSSLQTLYIERKGDIAPTWRGIYPIFSSLTVVSLWHISFTRNAAYMIQKAIQSNIKIQSLKLEFVEIEQNTPERRGIKNMVRTWFSVSNVSGKTLMRLNMRKCKQLRVLHIEHSDCLLKDITHSKFLVSLNLQYIRVQSSDMLQASLSSFTQLQKLVLDNISFSNDIRDKMRLDITACTGIKTLTLTLLHVDSIKINPVSLQKLTISHVSGSLYGVLSALHQCQHLRDLSIHSLSDEQDVKLLADVLPQLTQVRSMTYEGGTQCDTDNEGVVGYHSVVAQAVTRMTGLGFLKIRNIETGNLALTLTPLMTQIKDLELCSVRMTASSWGEFIDSLLTIQHGFDIELEDTNIDDKSVSAVCSSPHFEVTWDDKGNTKGIYVWFEFSKMSS